MAVSLEVVEIDKPEDANVIIGQAHFIKTVEDLHEALAGAGSHLRFGIAFCEASGPRLIRRSGNDTRLIDVAAPPPPPRRPPPSLPPLTAPHTPPPNTPPAHTPPPARAPS